MTLPRPDAAGFRRVMAEFPTGVTVVTSVDAAGRLVGMAVNAFTSVSLQPLLVLTCAAKTSDTWPVIRDVGSFAVNMLAADQADVCRRFVQKDSYRFEGVAFDTRPTGAPVLPGALAVLDCEIRQQHDGGDHWITISEVVGYEHLRWTRPLIFHRSSFSTLADLPAEFARR